MLVEGDARLASDPGAVEPHIRRNEWFACCFVDYAASDGMIHRFSDVVPNFRGHFTRLFGDQLRTARKVSVCGKFKIVVSYNVGGLNRSMQHWLAVYSPAFESPRSLAGVG